MKKLLVICSALSGILVSVSAFSDTGELWEITNKMDMPGAGFSMPETTSKVCLPKGAEKDPKQTASKDCEVTDMKSSGNKSSWKAKCTDHGNVMIGVGEITNEKDGYHGTMHITGKADGQPMDMTQTFRGKRLGEKCDTALAMCNTAQYNSEQFIGVSHLFLGKKPPCPGKEKIVCEAIRKDDVKLYVDILNHDKMSANNENSVQVAKACSLNMEGARKTACANNKNDSRFLKEYCPAEAKAYLEQARLKKQKECEGLDYTSSGGKCGSRQDSASDDTGSADSSSGSNAKRSTTQTPDAGQAGSASSASGPGSGSNDPANAVLDSAKKLKGLLGF